MTTAGGPEENCHRRRVALREDLLKAYDELDKEGTEIVPRLDLGKSIEAFVPRCPDLDVQDLSDMVRTLSSIVVEKDEYAGIVDRWVEHNNSKDAIGPSAPPAVGPPSPPAGPLSPSKKEAVDWLAGPSASPAPAPSPVPAAKLRGKGPAPGAQRLSSSTTATSPPTTLRGKAPPPEKVETSGRPRGPSAGGPGSPPVSPPSDVQKVSGASMSDFARSPEEMAADQERRLMQIAGGEVSSRSVSPTSPVAGDEEKSKRAEERAVIRKQVADKKAEEESQSRSPRSKNPYLD